MPDSLYTRVRKTLAQNLTSMIYDRGSTINAEARNRRIPQRSLAHLVHLDRDPQLSSICMVAEAFGLKPWQLLVPISERDDQARMLEWFAIYSAASPSARHLLDLAFETARKESSAS